LLKPYQKDLNNRFFFLVNLRMAGRPAK
jgi:hypothetical protein